MNDQRKPESAPETERREQTTMPPAGPHARPDLIDDDKTPGSGILPKHDEENAQPTG